MVKKFYHLSLGQMIGIKRKTQENGIILPDYGKFKIWIIGFQDHGSDLWFRNVKIRKL